jgi:hypothetical protein
MWSLAAVAPTARVTDWSLTYPQPSSEANRAPFAVPERFLHGHPPSCSLPLLRCRVTVLSFGPAMQSRTSRRAIDLRSAAFTPHGTAADSPDNAFNWRGTAPDPPGIAFSPPDGAFAVPETRSSSRAVLFDAAEIRFSPAKFVRSAPRSDIFVRTFDIFVRRVYWTYTSLS